MNKILKLLTIGLVVSMYILHAQVPYTANEKVTRYGDKDKEFFLYGANMAWRGAEWVDEIMGTILCSDPTEYGSEGPNANSLRPALYDRFVAQYGIEYRKKTFEHYVSKGAKVNTIFLSGPREKYRERICPKTQEEEALPYDLPYSFKNIYEPIWIKNESGNPIVNPDNYYAQYVYDVVSDYKSYTRFWEIWNEPDLTYKGNGEKEPKDAGNWWTNDPDPCELHNLRAPIQHYVRLLRISYEVIKSVDPEAIVCTGGIGYASFLDAILRNTDNPDGGKVDGSKYPHKGGAYFDCVSYHVYPMYYLRAWKGGNAVELDDKFTYFRHSDAAIEASVNHQKKLDDVLVKHGYGKEFPKKEWILSETNIPSERVKENGKDKLKWFIGSDDAQRNYLTKVAIACQKNEVDAIYAYCPYDNEKNGKEGEYDVMGFYKPLPDSPAGSRLTLKPAGKAWRTMVKMLAEYKYDANETDKLNLTKDKVDGGAFYSLQKKEYVYVLWAKTSKDLDETAKEEYTFSKDIQSITYTHWDGSISTVQGNKITLTGSPVFITVSTGSYVDVSSIRLNNTELEIDEGDEFTLIANIIPDNATNKEVTWKSSDESIASIDATGTITAHRSGTVTITATADKGIATICTVTVLVSSAYVPVSKVFLDPSSIELIVGESKVLTPQFIPQNASNKKLNWYSSLSTIVTVDTEGKITALETGTAWINAKSVEENGHAVCKVTVIKRNNPFIQVEDIELLSSFNMVAGESHVLTPTFKPENATNQNVIWDSSNSDIVKVDTEGKITALTIGVANIYAKSVENNSIYKICEVTVEYVPVESVEVIGPITLNVGESKVLTPTFKPENATNKHVKWYSSNNDMVKIDAEGKITALKTGTAWIRAESVEGNAKVKAGAVVVDNKTQKANMIDDKSPLLKFYPNPIKDKLHISGTTEGTLIEIYTSTGLLITNNHAQDGETIIDFSQFVPGIYLVKIGEETKKVVKN